MKSKVLFIHPGMASDERPYHPFECTFLAPPLEKAGYEVLIVDQRVLTESEWKSLLSKHIEEAIWVGFTVITGPQIHFALETARYIRNELKSDLPLVWGGWHPTFVPAQTIQHPLVDYIVIGIGETKIVELTKSFLAGTAPSYEGILSKRQLGTFPVSTKEDYTEPATMPAYHLLDMNKYRSSNNWAAMITARGCPFRCGFCTIAQVAYINRPLESVLDEIEYLVHKEGFTRINFADGLFFAQRSRVLKILDGIEERGLKFEWKASTRPETFRRWSKEQFERLVANGLVAVNTGIESGSPRMLKLITKDTVPEDALHLAEITGKYGIELTMSFMNGLPHETIEDLKLSIQHYHDLKERNPRVRLFQNFYQPCPGAPSYDEMIKLGWKPPATLEEWPQRIGYHIELDKIDPVIWMSPAEWAEYFDVYANSPFFSERLYMPFNKPPVGAPNLNIPYSKIAGAAAYEQC